MATEQSSIEVLLSDYAGVPSNADAGKIAGFYTADAVFMPEKRGTIKSAQRIGKSAENFLRRKISPFPIQLKILF